MSHVFDTLVTARPQRACLYTMYHYQAHCLGGIEPPSGATFCTGHRTHRIRTWLLPFLLPMCFVMVPESGIEPLTTRLSVERSTAELLRQTKIQIVKDLLSYYTTLNCVCKHFFVFSVALLFTPFAIRMLCRSIVPRSMFCYIVVTHFVAPRNKKPLSS